MNKKILVLFGLCLILLVGCGPFSRTKTVKGKLEKQVIKIPDVSNMSVAEAERTLIFEGFIVDSEIKEEESSTIEKGKVIGTEPASGRERPKGSIVTLIVSKGKGEQKYIIENYVGKNYVEVRATLENEYKMKVIIEKKNVDMTEGIDENTIIAQSIDVGTEIIISEKNPTRITLYIPDVYKEYPNFVEEGWSIEEIQDFAKKYNLTLSIKYQESNEPEGTVIAQSRTGKIVEGTTLIITVSK